MKKRINLSALALGMLLTLPAFAADWQNDDPNCAPSVYSETVSAAQQAQEKSQKDADAVNDFYKSIKENPRSASDLANSCVIDSWPDFSVGSMMGIDMNPIIDKIGKQVVDEACKKQRDLIRKADSAFKMPNIKSEVMSKIGQATNGITGNSGINSAINGAVNGAVNQGTNALQNGNDTGSNIDRLFKGGGNGSTR